jgi:hypothetical protein
VTAATAQRISTRWIPQNSTAVSHPRGSDIAVVYCYQSGPRPAALCYIGSAGKSSWHHSFFSEEARQKHIADTFAGIDTTAEWKAKNKAERQAPHDLKIGDIIVNSWGYEQTNIDWYVVTKTTDHYVWVQSIAAHMTPSESGNSMAGYFLPDLPPRPCKRCGSGEPDPPEKHAASTGGYVNFEHGSGHKWDGREERASWYA